MAAAGDLVVLDLFQEIETESAPLLPPMSPPTLDTLFTLSYTSGTTGRPKGAMISNGNMICALKSAEFNDKSLPDDVIINYLPLAHIFGRLAVYHVFGGGGAVGCWGGDPKQLVEDV